MRLASMLKAVFGFRSEKYSRQIKYAHYLFVTFLLVIVVSVLALLNAKFHFNSTTSYSLEQVGFSSSLLLAGYLGMFLTIWISPIPDYILVPVYGYLSSLGAFNPYTTFGVCLVGALLPIEYVSGRFAGRLLLLKILSNIHVSEKSIDVADKWIIEHGKFSIFISTFIPFFYSVSSLAAGMLKMNWAEFLLSSTGGFGLRFIFLELVGYYTIYIFSASFDYSHRFLFFALLTFSLAYVAVYAAGTLGRTRSVSTSQT
jgi:membrane protein DedA with SNARE-associated domain